MTRLVKPWLILLGLSLAGAIWAVPDLKAAAETQGAAAGTNPTGSAKPDVFEVPKLIKGATPEYPDLARELGKSGSVVVAVVIGANGKVAKATVVSSTDTIFEPAALAAVKQWVFAPGKKNGKPVAVAYTTPPIVFNLRTR